jgi:hypothetical protein
MNAVNEIGEPLRSVQPTVTKSCKGAACPLFMACQGRCAPRQRPQRIAPDGGVWIESRG